MVVGVALLLVGIAWSSNKQERAAASSPTPSPASATDASFLGCTQCHGNLDKNLPSSILKYTHKVHFSKGVSECSVCHLTPTHAQDKINPPTMSRCFLCHGTTAQAIAPGTCSTCHPPSVPNKPESHLAASWVPSVHWKQAQDNKFECMTCHQQSFCNSCHGLTMPHPTGWKGVPHTQAFFQDPQVCQQCHPITQTTQSFCDTCHHPQDPKGVSWIQYHHKVVGPPGNAGAFTCFQCHSPQTCEACHVNGTTDFSPDQNYSPMPIPSPSLPGG